MRIVSFTIQNSYEYDEKGNWVVKIYLDDKNKVTDIEKRIITYYK